MMISRVIGYAFAAVAMCFGALAFADTGEGYRSYLSYQTASAFESSGKYGHDVALYEARQSQMRSVSSSLNASAAGLMKDSHGFLQAAASEVTGGTTGSTVSLTLS